MDRIETIAAFAAVADERSFVAAARLLRRSPAAVTRAVAGLERRLGVRLFQRTTRAVSLTDAGRRHLDQARRVLSEFEGLEAAVAVEHSAPSGLVTVASSLVFGRLHVQPLVTAFLGRHRGVSVRLELADQVASIVSDGIDVAIRLGTLPDSTLKSIRVGQVRRSVYASPAYLAAHGAPAVPAELTRHACISFTGTAARAEHWTFGSGRRPTTIRVAPRLTTNVADVAIDAAVGGLGLTCVLSYMVDHLVAAGALRPVLVDFEPPPRPIHVVHAAGRRPTAAVRAFVDLASGALRAKFAR